MAVGDNEPPSVAQSEDEHKGQISREERPPNHFRFFDLPFELRERIFDFALAFPVPIDLHPANKKDIAPLLKLFRTCRRVYEEAYPVFYGKNTFQVFPTSPAYLNAKPRQLLLTRFPRKYREEITSLQLRFGPGWANPPKCQAVKPKLGLTDCRSVKELKVFVECDPSQDVFENFRFSHTFYTMFCRNLMKDVLDHVPSVKVVEFDAYPSVTKGDALMEELALVAELCGKQYTWSPRRGWDGKEVEESLGDWESE